MNIKVVVAQQSVPRAVTPAMRVQVLPTTPFDIPVR